MSSSSGAGYAPTRKLCLEMECRVGVFSACALARILNCGGRMNAAHDLVRRRDQYHSEMVIADRYRLLRHLDEGGMSWVWLARHLTLDTLVAVKIVKPDRFTSHASSQVAEARITAGLRHPAIVTVLDAGYTCWNDAFVVMEHLEGNSLAQVLSRDVCLTPQAAVGMMLPILGALSCCHEHGILHGDVKPGNVFLVRERGRTRAKLLGSVARRRWAWRRAWPPRACRS